MIQPEYKDEKPVNSYYFIDRLSESAPCNVNILRNVDEIEEEVKQVFKKPANEKE